MTLALVEDGPLESWLAIEGLYRDWDAEPSIRGRLRDGRTFLHPDTELKCNNTVCILNAAVLTPVLKLMQQNCERKLPGVSDLRTEMAECYGINKRGTNSEDSSTIIGDSWHIRKLLSFVKAKVRREEVSNEPQTFINYVVSLASQLCPFYCQSQKTF